jgi:two-component system sensor histidine kinase PilS (NtrC family)
MAEFVLERQLKLLMLLRIVVITTLLLIAIYVETVSETLLRVNPLFVVITATYAVTIVYVWALQTLRHLERQAYVQCILDLVVVTGLVYVTGWSSASATVATVTRGGFMLLYPMSVLSGAAILARRRGLTLAALAALMYASLLWLVRVGAIPPLGLQEIPTLPVRPLVYSVFVTGVVCATVALIGTYLSEALRRLGSELEVATGQVADLRELNERIVGGIQSGLLTTDAKGTILSLNPFGEAVLGRREAEVCGRTLDDVFASPLLSAALLQARESTGLRRLEFTYIHPDGTTADLGGSVSFLGGQPGSGGHLLVFQDLTEIKRLEEEVQTKEKLAAVGEMAAHLAHEIRNPLGSISGSAQVLMIEANISPEQERLLSIIHKECKRLSDSLSQFLVQVRPVPRSRGPVDLASVISEGVTLLRNGPEVGPLHTVEFDPLPGPQICLGDRDQLLQVFWNLARNGLEAMPEGGTLTIELTASAGEIVLSIRDQGRGMSREEKRRMFEPFHSRTPAGTGLGLAIVYRIVREHSGDIAVETTPHEGTVVIVRLPLMSMEPIARARPA